MFLFVVFTLIASCTTYKPILPSVEMQKLSDDEFENYFLKRLDEVIFPEVFSERYTITKKVSDGYTARDMRVGTVSGIIDKHTPLFNKCRNEYDIMKSEIMRRSTDKDQTLLKKSIAKADDMLKQFLDKMYTEYNNVITPEMKSQSNYQGIMDTKRLYEISTYQKESMGSLVEVLFERRYE